MTEKKQKVQYYTMVTEKYLEILDSVTQEHSVISDILKESVSTVKINKWNESETSDVIETYVVINSFKKLLENKLKNPTFTDKAPKEIIASIEEKLVLAQNSKRKLLDNLFKIKSLESD